LSKNLAGLTIAIVYGDRRDIYLAKKLIGYDTKLLLVGFDNDDIRSNFEEMDKVEFYNDLINPAKKSDVMILPIPGVDNQGLVKSTSKSKFYFTEEVAGSFQPHTLVLVGMSSPYLLNLKEQYSFSLMEIAELNDFAILNSIPSAEGAIAKAMELTSITIHNSNSMIIGLGRVGITLARMLNGLGANTYVAARSSEQLARALEMNCHLIELKHIDEKLSKMDIIFNTVPALILSEQKLKLINNSCVIIDLASAPGGLDYDAAEKLGIITYLAPGLPGKVAPVTAGNILGYIYPGLIIDHISKSKGGVTHVC